MTPSVAILVGACLAQAAVPARDTRPTLAATIHASLTGRVVDDRGTPVPGVVVIAVGGPPPGAHPAITTEDGRYVIPDLEPGLYTISAGKPGYPTIAYGQTRPNGPGKPFEIAHGQRYALPLTLPRGAVIAGTLVNEYGEPLNTYVSITPDGAPPTARNPLIGRMTVNAAGSFRAYGLRSGTYQVSAGRPASPSADGNDGAEVIRVTVEPGEERDGIVVHARSPQPTHTTYVTVQLQGADAQGVRYPQVNLRRPGEPRPISTTATPNPDGSRTLTDVAAGQYRVIAHAGASWGATDITVDGEHPATTAVTLTRGVTVRGIATFDGTAPHGRITVYLAAADADGLADDNNGAMGSVAPDGTFAIAGVPPGRFVIEVFYSNTDPWRLASARVGDADATDVPLTVGHDDIDGARIVLTTSRTMLKGVVSRTDGSPANGVAVVAFPIDDAFRSVRNSRRVATSQTTIAGEYEIGGLPPGRYGVAVEDEVDREALRDPAGVAKLRPVVTVTLAPGENKAQNITIR